MADSKFGGLTEATALNSTDEFCLSLTGSNGSRKITTTNLFGTIPVAVTMGSATVDSGTFTMIKGAQTGDPQVQFALSADALGNFSTTADTGEIQLNAKTNIRLYNDSVNYATLAGGDFYLGTSAVDTGSFVMIKGAQTGDPQFSISLSADANGDTTFVADTGDVIMEAGSGRNYGVVNGTFVAGSYNGDFNIIHTTTKATLYMDTYDAGTEGSRLYFQRSDSDTCGTLAQTDSGDILGDINWLGVTTGSARGLGAIIRATQDGTSGGTYVPTNLELRTHSDSAANSNQLVLHNDGKVCIGDDGTYSTGDFNVLKGGGGGVDVAFDSYDSTPGDDTTIFLRHSKSSTLGTKTRTIDGDGLGKIIWQGVSAGGAFIDSFSMKVLQDGATDTYAPSNLILETYSDTALNSNQLVLDSNGDVYGHTSAISNQHKEIGILLDELTSPVAIVGFTGTGADTATESGYESGAGRTWTYSGGLATDKIFKGQTYVYSFDGTDSYLSTPDTADMSFDDSGANPVSMGGWVQVTDGGVQTIISKWDETTGSELREWMFLLASTEKLNILLYDESANVQCSSITDAALSLGWHHVVVVYDSTGGATAANGITFYVDGVAVASTPTNNGSYVAMENTASLPFVGAITGTSGSNNYEFAGDMGRLFVTPEELSAATVWKLYEKTRGFYNV